MADLLSPPPRHSLIYQISNAHATRIKYTPIIEQMSPPQKNLRTAASR